MFSRTTNAPIQKSYPKTYEAQTKWYTTSAQSKFWLQSSSPQFEFWLPIIARVLASKYCVWKIRLRSFEWNWNRNNASFSNARVHVVMVVRNMITGREVKAATVKQIPYAKIDAMELNLISMTSVRKFAVEFKSSGLPLNLLMNYGYTFYAF